MLNPCDVGQVLDCACFRCLGNGIFDVLVHGEICLHKEHLTTHISNHFLGLFPFILIEIQTHDQ